MCLVLAAAIAAVELAAWLVPPLGRAMPDGWMAMKANTALCALLSTVSLELSGRRVAGWRRHLWRGCAVLVGVIALLVCLEYIFHLSFGVDTLLSADPGVGQPGRMSPQTAASFFLLSLSLILVPMRKRLFIYVTDLYVCSLCVLVLVVGSGYLFQALHLFGISRDNMTSPQTLVCLVLLSFVVFGRQAEYGIFSILLGSGTASRMARVVLPIAMALPFMLEATKAILIKEQLAHTEYATAIAATLGVVVAFGMILVLARGIDRLERSIRDLSLRDELTGLYNRRGFYMLAEQALLQAQRSEGTLSVLFIDVDDLKRINDEQGHEVGSELLHEVGAVLKESFRRTDVIARLGGDEFVVAGVSSAKAMGVAVERMKHIAEERNAQPGRAYPFSFSYGHVTSVPGERETVDDLLGRADVLMYENKRRKKLGRPADDGAIGA